MTRAGAPITSKGELPFDSDGELTRERITRSHGNREALPLDRVWKAEQIRGGKGIYRQESAEDAISKQYAVTRGLVAGADSSIVIECAMRHFRRG